MNVFESLPEELLLEQLLLLPPEDVISACRINRQFAEVGRKVNLWIRLIRRDLPLVELNANPKKIYLAGLKIRREFPEVSWIELKDPIAFCNYMSIHLNDSERFRNMSRDPVLATFILLESKADGNYCSTIFNDPEIASIFFKTLHPIHVDKSRPVLQYRRIDGTTHITDITDPLIRSDIVEVIVHLIESQQELKAVTVDFGMEEALRNMGKGIDPSMAYTDRYLLLYRRPNGIVHVFELPSWYKPRWIRPIRHEPEPPRERELANLRSGAYF